MSKHLARIVTASLLSLGLVACGSSDEPIRLTGPALTAAASCGDVEAAYRQAAIQTMKQALKQNLQAALSGETYCYEYDAAPAAGGSGEDGGGAKQVSTTNNQVAGVDEADFVKNDNQYIYIVSGETLRIIDAWPAADAHEIAKVALPGTGKKLFVEGDRAFVYSSPTQEVDPNGYYNGYGASECTYGRDCEFTGDGLPTDMSVFDISDRTAPKLERTIHATGSLITARRIGKDVHTVLYSDGPRFDVGYWPDGVGSCGNNLTDALLIFSKFEQLERDNIEIIMNTPLTHLVPSTVDTTYDADGNVESAVTHVGDCTTTFTSPLADGEGFISLLSTGVDAGAPLSETTIISRPGAVYASDSALYVAARQQRWAYGWYDGYGDLSQLTTIHKFDLDSGPARTTYAASGIAKGSVLNQFALDEWNGHLRVVASSGYLPDPDTHSTLTELEQQGTSLVEVGRIDHIAPSEDIRSVRFAGDRGFVVTFKKTDPLFVFDLSDAKHPKTLGELKIPGFSTYMHMLDDTHLLTIGYDADDQGEFAWFAGVMLQIFDVTDPKDPTLLHKTVIGTRGSSSEALTNHLAFNYFAPKNLLALPMTICEGGSGGGYGTDMTFSGLMVYDVSLKDGFDYRGGVSHPTDPSTGEYDNAACGHWWTQASTEVKRSIFMDDFVYSVSETAIKVDSLDALGEDLVTLDLTK